MDYWGWRPPMTKRGRYYGSPTDDLHEAATTYHRRRHVLPSLVRTDAATATRYEGVMPGLTVEVADWVPKGDLYFIDQGRILAAITGLAEVPARE